MLSRKLKVLCVLPGAMLVAQSLVGCSPMPLTAQEARSISPDRQYAYREKDEASLVLTRDKGWYDGDQSIDFLIDGKLVATVRRGEVARFGLRAGPHIIAVSTGDALVEREINLKVGETIRRRIPDGSVLDVTPTVYK